MRAITYVELDLSYCSLSYGVAPCTASGGPFCFNTIKTCQDREHYTDQTKTLRFARDTLDLPQGIECIPCVESVSFNPGTLSLGQDLGTRSSLTVTLREFRHSDVGAGGDKYWEDRGYNPYDTGTFWSKFRSRQPYLRGRPLRLIQGRVGQSLEEMETRHFIVESFTGPDADGTYTLIAKDILKSLDSDRSQAPRLSSGFLITDIDAGDTLAQLAPSGIGDAEYPSSGFVAIGGTEICSFTRSGDSLTLVRGQYRTSPVAHDSQDRVQLVLIYDAQTPADIIHDLMVNYGELFNPSWINLPEWELEVNTHLRRLYSAAIPEPTSVSQLISELIEQAALAVWWDDLATQVRLQVLRPIVASSLLTADEYMGGTLQITDQPSTRVSEVWTYYGQINPLRPVSDADNYRSARVDINLQSVSDYGVNSIKKIMSRWIPAFGSQVAIRVNQITLSRFSDPPRKFGLRLLKEFSKTPLLGEGKMLEGRALQTAEGLPLSLPIQITRVTSDPDSWGITAEEANFTQLDNSDLSDRVIILDSQINNINLRSLHDSIYPEPDPLDPPTLKLIINEGVYVWSTNTSRPALNIGSWPSFMEGRISVQCNGIIQGAGGRGGAGKGGDNTTGGTGLPGGTALYTRFPIILDLSGKIRGGGGGGGGGGGDFVGLFGPQINGGGGGGGAGAGQGGPRSWPGEPGNGGSLDAGGLGGENGQVNFGSGSSAGNSAGTGGGPGQSGGTASGIMPGVGGAPGRAVDGWSEIVEGTVTGSYVGALVN